MEWIGPGTAAGLGLFGWGIRESQWWRLVRYDVEIGGLAPAFEGFTILHLSDLHGRVGVFSWPPFRAALARAHLVALTGDYFTATLPRRRVAAALDALAAPHGVWAVSGNHDYRRGCLYLDPWRPGPRWLDNRVTMVRKDGARLWLAGVADLVRGRPELEEVAQACRGGDAAVLLSHRPDVVLLTGARRFQLVLAGHTHGGQVAAPGGRAPLRHTRLPGPYVAGRLDRPGQVLITSRGLGTSELPVRLFSRPEVVEVRLYRPKDREAEQG